MDRPTALVETLAETGGRPLGLELLPDGALLVCDAERGLLRVDLADGTARVLADSVAGEGLQCANGLAPSRGESFLVVAETAARRLTRY